MTRADAGGSARASELSVVDGLVQLSFAVYGLLSRIAADNDLSMTQVRLLGVLQDREPTMMQLAQHLGLDKSSVTGLIDRAERRGLVRRLEMPDDGRAIRVAITPRGLALAETGRREVERQIDLLLAGLSASERKSIRSLTSKLVAAIAV